VSFPVEQSAAAMPRQVVRLLQKEASSRFSTFFVNKRKVKSTLDLKTEPRSFTVASVAFTTSPVQVFLQQTLSPRKKIQGWPCSRAFSRPGFRKEVDSLFHQKLFAPYNVTERKSVNRSRDILFASGLPTYV
jgi:hypothetical protein